MTDVLPVLVREAWLRGALLYLRGIGPAAESPTLPHFDALWRALKELPVHCVVEGKDTWR